MKLKIISILIALVLFASFAYADSAVRISPNPANDQSTLNCAVTAGGSGYTYSWSRNGAGTGISLAYVQPGYLHAGDTWTCVVTKFYPGGIGWITIGSDSVYITHVNAPPAVQIASPANWASFIFGTNINFAGTGSDAEDGTLSGASLNWYADGTWIGSGNSVNYAALPAGQHQITLIATDSGSLTASTAIMVVINPVPNNAPSVQITNPANWASFNFGTSINFAGTALDPEDGVLSGASLRWYADGVNFGSGNSVNYASLSAGSHLITLVATDSKGATASTSISVVINASVNHPPFVEILSPEDGETFHNGSLVFLLGNATDPEDGIITNKTAWLSDLDGMIAPEGNPAFFAYASSNPSTIAWIQQDNPIALTIDGIQHEITVVDVTDAQDSCGVSVDGYVRWMEKNSRNIVNGVYIRVLDIKAVNSTLQNQDLCRLNIKSISDADKLSWGTHKITFVAEDSGSLRANDSVYITINGSSANQTNQSRLNVTLTASQYTGISPLKVNFTCSAANGTAPYNYSWMVANSTFDIWGMEDGVMRNSSSYNFSLTLNTGSYAAACFALDANNRWGVSSAVNITVLGNQSNQTNATRSLAIFASPASLSNLTVNSTAHYIIDIRNNGSLNDSYTITFSNPNNATVNLNPQHIVLDAGYASSAVLQVKGAENKTYHVIVTVTSDANHSVNASVDVPTSYSLVADTIPPFIYGLHVGSITNTSAIIYWNTNEESDSLVQYGTNTSNLTMDAFLQQRVLSHSVLIATLEPNTTYYFNLTSCDEAANCARAGTYGFSTLQNSAPHVNSFPVVSIITPSNGAIFPNGTAITFEGSAIDAEDGAAIPVAWYFDGQYAGNSRIFTSSLPVGIHTITFSATDYNTATSNASITINITASVQNNNNPTINIISPNNNGVFSNRSYIWFNAIASDPEDGILTGNSIKWYDNGINFANGTSKLTNNLTVGVHNITAFAFDRLSAAGSDSITITINSSNRTNLPPAAAILAPSNNSIFENGTAITFEGSAIDPEDGFALGNFAWYSDRDGQISTSLLFTYSGLSVGPHVITFVATDIQKASGAASINITIRNASSAINQPPRVNITSPADNATFAPMDYIIFTAFATDPEDGVLAGNSVQWYDNGLNFGNGTSLWLNNLANGTHNITAVAADRNGTTGSSTIAIHVGSGNVTNSIPIINITSPAENSTFSLGNYIMFNSQATDPEDGVLTGNSIHWYDNGNNFANGTSAFTNSFAIGNHNVTATATDRNSNSASDSINISITVQNISNNPPFVNITAPRDNATFEQNSTIVFVGYGYDPEDGILSGVSLLWVDNDSNLIGTGTTATVSNLSPGNHTIVLYGYDSDFAVANDSIIIHILPASQPNQSNRTAPNVTIILPADNSNFTVNSTIQFLGMAIDANGSTIPNVQWVSSIDSAIGSNLSFARMISEGIHNITLVATDSYGLQGSDTVLVRVINYSNNQTNQTNATNMTVTLTANPVNGTVPLFVNFNCSVQNGVGEYDYIITTITPNQTIMAFGNFSINATSFEFGYLLNKPGSWTQICEVKDYSTNLSRNASLAIMVFPLNQTGNNTNNTNQTNQTNQTAGIISVNIISPANGANYPSNQVLVSINASDYSNVTYRIDNGAAYKYTIPFIQYLANGNHSIIAMAANANGTDADSAVFTVSYSAPETNPPVVKLFSPGDRSVQKQSNVDFMFNATDNTGVNSCILRIDGLYVKSQSAQDGMNTINYNMPSGEHSWQVACSDANGNIGYSETRQITIMTGNFTYYQPPLKPKVQSYEYELTLRNIEYDEYVHAGDLVPVTLTASNTGDFDIKDLRISVSIYDLDAYAQSTVDIDDGKEKTKTLYLELPEDAKPGVYDIKIDAGNSRVKRSIYREITVI